MSDKTVDISEIARAKNFLEMSKGKWRLQTMQYRSRLDPKTGQYRRLPTRIRRFLNGTPVGMKGLVLSILKDSAPYESPVFDCEIEPGLKYRPTNTFIRKDGIEHTTGGKDATYTIIQDLLLDDGTGDAFGFTDESSCSQKGTTEYHWDEPSVIDCPDGVQGVSFQISDINRDRETDLFSYRIRSVHALTVHVSPHVTDCDARKRVTVEIWDNVYGEPGSFRWDSLRANGEPIGVPAPCEQTNGRTVKVDVYRNPDCTYRVTVQTVEAKTDESQYSIYRDQYKVNSVERTVNAFAPLPKEGVEYSGGVTHRYTSERNEDGTYNNSVETDTERPVPSSAVERRITPRGTHVTRVDTNQPTAADGIATQFGSWKYTKTPGGLFNNEYSEYVRRIVDNLGLMCNDTLFSKTHETQASVDSVPAGSHVPPARNGLVTTWTYDTDSDGFVTRRVRTEQEHTVEFAVKRRTWGFLGTTSGYQHRSVAAAVAENLYASGETGTSVEVRRTNGGLYDVDVQTFLRISGLVLGFDCSKTVYQHVHETVVSATTVGDEATDAGDGHTWQRSFSVDTTTGAITQRDRDTTELYVQYARRTTRVTARGTSTSVSEANAVNRPADAGSPGEEVSWEQTPGGRYNVTRTTTTPRSGSTGLQCERDVFQHSHSSTGTRKTAPGGHVNQAGGGKYYSRNARLGDDGLWEVTDAEVTEERDVDNGTDVSVTARGVRKTTRVRQTNKPAEPGASEIGRSVRSQRTRGGLYDVEETVTTPATGDVAVTCEKDAFTHADGTTKMAKDKPSGHVTGGTGGKYASRSARLGDDGLWEVVENEVEEEQSVDNGVDVVVTSRGVRKTTKTRQTTKPTEPSATDYGKAVRSQRTRGGLYDVEETETTPAPGDVAVTCEKDAFLHADGTTKMSKDKPEGHVEGGTDGKYGTRAARLGDDGLWEVVENEVEEQEVSERSRNTRVTKFGLVRRITDMQTDRGDDEPRAVIEDIGKELTNEKTRGGKFNVTRVELEAITGATDESCEKTAFLHTHVTSEVILKKPNNTETSDAGGGKYVSRSWSLTDIGTWEQRETEHTEEQPIVAHARNYQDAFGTTEIREDFSHESDAGPQGKLFSREQLIRSVEASMTNGKRYNVRTVTEKPVEVDSGWLHFSKTTTRGLAVYYDFIVFRNADKAHVKLWIRDIELINYGGLGDTGSYANHPSINISPNKFGLWDGSVSLTTTYTPKEWASGGNTKDDNWEKDDIKITSVNFVPLSATKLLKIVTEETHCRGGGVGRDRLEAKLAGGIIKGSQFSFHPSGQSYSYDLITEVNTKGIVMDMPGTQQGKELWNGGTL